MKTYNQILKEFSGFEKRYIPNEGHVTDVVLIDNDGEHHSIRNALGHSSYFVDVDKEQHSCWVKINNMDWAMPIRFEDIKIVGQTPDGEHFAEVWVSSNTSDYGSFLYWQNNFDKVPEKVKNFKPENNK